MLLSPPSPPRRLFSAPCRVRALVSHLAQEESEAWAPPEMMPEVGLGAPLCGWRFRPVQAQLQAGPLKMSRGHVGASRRRLSLHTRTCARRALGAAARARLVQGAQNYKTHPRPTRASDRWGLQSRQPSSKAPRLRCPDVGRKSSSSVPSDGSGREGAAGQSGGVRKRFRDHLNLLPTSHKPLRGLRFGNMERVRAFGGNTRDSHPALITHSAGTVFALH